MKEGETYDSVQREESFDAIESGPSSHLLSSSQGPHQRPWAQKLLWAGILVCTVVALSAGALAFNWHMHSAGKHGGLAAQGGKKNGAGLLLCSEDKVLLLLRNSKHNDSTWGLPGGNVEAVDDDLQATAEREALEELGHVPEYTISTSILTKRGKHNQKHYTVFIAGLATAVDRDTYTPELNHEHREARWWAWAELVGESAPPLHPVLHKLTQEPLRKELASVLPMWEQLEAAAVGGQVSTSKAKDEDEGDDDDDGSGDDDDDDNVDEDDDDDDRTDDKNRHHKQKRRRVKRRGSGLLLVNGEEGIFLLRNSSHNNNTWDLPGGNVDLTDPHLEAAARREAIEELGACPNFTNAGAILTKRGKHDEKHFTIFVGWVGDDERGRFHPKLSDESLACQWRKVKDVANLKAKDVHPRLEELFHGRNREELQDILKFGF